MKTNTIKLICMSLVFVLLISIVPSNFISASTPEPKEVNEYSIEVSNFIKGKCKGKCENIILVGDDYVIPSFRRNLKMLNWHYFLPWLPDSRVDRILTDVGYVQRSEMEFSNLYGLVTKQLDGNNFEGKDMLIILPDSLTSEQERAIDDLKEEFETKFKSDFYEKDSSEIYCNDLQLWDNMNGYTLLIIGTEENNQAYNCFPFQAGEGNRNAAFIDINPWDGRNYAIIFNTEDPLIIDTFTQFIHDETFEGIRSETAYFLKVGTKIAVTAAFALAVVSGVGAAAGIAGAGTLAIAANVVNIAADAATVADSCYYDTYKYGEGLGGCVIDAAIVIILPKVLEKGTKYILTDVVGFFSKFSDDAIRVYKSPMTGSVLKDGTEAAGIAVLREGTEAWGWKHILLRNHNNQIKAAFKLADNNQAVKDLIGEALASPNLVKNGNELIYQKTVNGQVKKLVMVMGDDADKLGAIITAYPN